MATPPLRGGKRRSSCRLSDCSQVFHASYVLQVVSKRVDKELVPMRDFVIGSASLQTRRLSPNNLSEPRRDELTVRLPTPVLAADLSVPFDARKPPDRVSPLRTPIRDAKVKKSPHMRRSSRINVPPLTGLAEQNTLVDSLVPHDNSEQLKQDTTLVPPPQIPLLPTTTTTAPFCLDCPRIDLVALVREKQKATKLRKQKLSVSKGPRRRVISNDMDPKKSR